MISIKDLPREIIEIILQIILRSTSAQGLCSARVHAVTQVCRSWRTISMDMLLGKAFLACREYGKHIYIDYKESDEQDAGSKLLYKMWSGEGYPVRGLSLDVHRGYCIWKRIPEILKAMRSQSGSTWTGLRTLWINTRENSYDYDEEETDSTDNSLDELDTDTEELAEMAGDRGQNNEFDIHNVARIPWQLEQTLPNITRLVLVAETPLITSINAKRLLAAYSHQLHTLHSNKPLNFNGNFSFPVLEYLDIHCTGSLKPIAFIQDSPLRHLGLRGLSYDMSLSDLFSDSTRPNSQELSFLISLVLEYLPDQRHVFGEFDGTDIQTGLDWDYVALPRLQYLSLTNYPQNSNELNQQSFPDHVTSVRFKGTFDQITSMCPRKPKSIGTFSVEIAQFMDPPDYSFYYLMDELFNQTSNSTSSFLNISARGFVPEIPMIQWPQLSKLQINTNVTLDDTILILKRLPNLISLVLGTVCVEKDTMALKVANMFGNDAQVPKPLNTQLFSINIGYIRVSFAYQSKIPYVPLYLMVHLPKLGQVVLEHDVYRRCQELATTYTAKYPYLANIYITAHEADVCKP